MFELLIIPVYQCVTTFCHAPGDHCHRECSCLCFHLRRFRVPSVLFAYDLQISSGEELIFHASTVLLFS